MGDGQLAPQPSLKARRKGEKGPDGCLAIPATIGGRAWRNLPGQILFPISVDMRPSLTNADIASSSGCWNASTEHHIPKIPGGTFGLESDFDNPAGTTSPLGSATPLALEGATCFGDSGGPQVRHRPADPASGGSGQPEQPPSSSAMPALQPSLRSKAQQPAVSSCLHRRCRRTGCRLWLRNLLTRSDGWADLPVASGFTLRRIGG